MAPQGRKLPTPTKAKDQSSPPDEFGVAIELPSQTPAPSTSSTKTAISFGNPTPIRVTPRTTTHHGPTPKRKHSTLRSQSKLENDQWPTSAYLAPPSIPAFHPGGIVPRRQLPGFDQIRSPERGGPTGFMTSATSATVTATAHSVLDDGMSDLPPLPAPVVGILAVLTILGFTAAIVVYLLTFPPPCKGFFTQLKHKIIGSRTVASPHELRLLNPHTRDDEAHTSSSDNEDNSASPSPSSPIAATSSYLSPRPPNTPFAHHRPSTRTKDPRLRPPLPGSPLTETAWLARRRAFETDEEALTPRVARQWSGKVKYAAVLNTPTSSPLGPGISALGRSESYSGAGTGSEARKRRRPRPKTWLSSIDGMVDRAMGSAAKWLGEEGDGEGGFDLPRNQ